MTQNNSTLKLRTIHRGVIDLSLTWYAVSLFSQCLKHRDFSLVRMHILCVKLQQLDENHQLRELGKLDDFIEENSSNSGHTYIFEDFDLRVAVLVNEVD